MEDAAPETGISPTHEKDRQDIEGILRCNGLFREAEIRVALEVLDIYLFQKGQEDYQIQSARAAGGVVGYVCFGRNAMTDGVFELYWIAIEPRHQRRGVGTRLMAFAESEALRQGGRMMAVETSSREEYRPAREFYQRRGYREAGRVPSFYAVGDDKIILVKSL